ncbi:MAG: hypothetical protein ACJ8FS_16325 [Sphingomicrobium sp.]
MGLRRIYRANSPYLEADLSLIDYAQTADVMYLAHINYDLQKSIRYSHTDWAISTVTFGPLISPPTGISGAATTPNTTGYVAQSYKYVVTSIKDSSPVQESRASSIVTVTNDLTLNGNYNTITVPAPSGDVARHVIYKEEGGAYGYIGATDGTSFKDQQLQPILSETPPVGENPFSGAGDKPSCVSFHQQRLALAGTLNVINGVWLSRSADPENMDRSRPARADDSLSFALLAEKVNGITGLASMEELLVLTTDSIFAIQGNQSGVVTPGDINPKRTTGRGARKVKPLNIDTVTFFVPSRANRLRTLGFSFDIAGYKSDNVTIFAPHLFRTFGLIKMVYQEEPFSIVWGLRGDGVLLAFTWEIEQQVWGWSVVETQGSVEDIEIIPEAGYDRLYALIRRIINGTERLFHERMAMPHTDITQACHLDCAYTNVFDTPQDYISGVWHLEGATVSMIYDGYVAHDLVVTQGRVDVPDGNTASVITVGLRYSGRAESLPAALSSQGTTEHVNRQQIGDIVVRTIDTRGIEIGARGAPLEAVEPKDGDEVEGLMDVSQIDYKVVPAGDWKDTSTVVIEQNEPLPAHIVGIFYSMLGATT